MKIPVKIENIMKTITCKRNYKSTRTKNVTLPSTLLLSLCIFSYYTQAIQTDEGREPSSPNRVTMKIEKYIDMKTQMDIFLTESGLTEKQYKEIHFARNNKQKSDVNYSDISASDSGFRKLSPEKSIFHQIGPGNQKNEKWTNAKGEEYVFNPSTNPPKLVTDSANIGTYNYRPESDIFGHYLLDVLPYLLWGNSEFDPTTFEKRVRLYEKAIDETIRNIVVSRLNKIQPDLVPGLLKPADDYKLEIIFQPLDFISKLAPFWVLMPRVNLTRPHGLFVSNSKHRGLWKNQDDCQHQRSGNDCAYSKILKTE